MMARKNLLDGSDDLLSERTTQPAAPDVHAAELGLGVSLGRSCSLVWSLLGAEGWIWRLLVLSEASEEGAGAVRGQSLSGNLLGAKVPGPENSESAEQHPVTGPHWER